MVAQNFIKLFTLLEIIEAGFSSKHFKTFLFGLNVKLVDKNVDDEEIINEFRKNITSAWKKEDIKKTLEDYDGNLLIYLNEYLYANQIGAEFNIYEKHDIEHIMPQSGVNLSAIRKDAGITDNNEFNEYLNKIGNKILLESRINRNIQNAWFKTKKDKYKDSQYLLASKTLAQYPSDTWNKDEIEKNTKQAVERIANFIFS